MLREMMNNVETVSTDLNLLVRRRQIHLCHRSEGEGLLELMIPVSTYQTLIEQLKAFTWNRNREARHYAANGFWRLYPLFHITTDLNIIGILGCSF